MLTVSLALAILAVPLFGGRLRKLAKLRFAHPWLLLAALALQVALFGTDGGHTPLRAVVHLGSYAMAFAFLYLNRSIPGMWLIALGAAANLIAITANGGVMPAATHALATAGIPLDSGTVFENSSALRDPNLLILGDIFALPKSLPFANVFSVGDLLIVVGAVVTIHRTCGSRLVPEGGREFVPLLRNGGFVRLLGAQLVSNLGDWVYSLSVALLLADRVDGRSGVAILATLLIVQYVPSAIFGVVFAGPLVDRRSRRGLMVASDVARGLAIASLLLVGEPSILHFYAVALLLGVFGSLFQPALLASVPNVVEPRQVVAAQSLVSATLHVAVVAGPALGGYLISRLSPTSVFGINAASFLVSGVLIGTVSIARNPRARTVAASGLSDLREGFRYVASNRLARAILVVVGLVSLGAATKTPLEPLFVRDVLADGDVLGAGSRIFGLITASWGLGMLLGSVTVPGIARRWPRERLLPIGVAIVGLMVLVVSRTDDFSTVLLAWFLAGWANALGNVSYETLLQERTPDALRGRVFAVTEAIADSAYVAGALLAAGIGAILAVQDVLAIAGSVMLFGAAAGLVLLPSPGARPTAADKVDARDDAAPPAAQAGAGAS